MSKCVRNENKQYIIPTQKWLKSIEPLITSDSNTSGLLMIGELIDKEKVIVKISKNINKKIILFGKILNNLYNFVFTYCSFNCTEDYRKIDNKYEDKKYFCSTTSNTLATIEIMKRYEGSLTRLKGKLTLKQVFNIISQLSLAAMEAFYVYGFVHEDISLGNILYKRKSITQTIEYKLMNDTEYKLEILVNDIVPLISDFDKTESFKQEIYERYSEEPMNTLLNGYGQTIILFDSLSKIIQNSILLLEDNDENYNIKKNIYNLIGSPDYETWYRWTFKSLRDYIRDNEQKSYNEMIKETFIVFKIFMNKIMKIINNNENYIFIPNKPDPF
jgi:CRISPR/Cas system CMR-associated protein Cmr5 small subunit